MTDAVIWYLDWVVAYEGRSEQPTGASSAGQFILIFAKTTYSQRLQFPPRFMNLRNLTKCPMPEDTLGVGLASWHVSFLFTMSR